MKISNVIHITLISFFFLLSSCQDSNKPQAIARKFIISMNEKKFEEAKTYCTPKTAEFMDILIKMGANTGNLSLDKNSELRDSIVGDVAYVFKNKSSTNPKKDALRLIKVEGKWFVDFAQ